MRPSDSSGKVVLGMDLLPAVVRRSSRIHLASPCPSAFAHSRSSALLLLDTLAALRSLSKRSGDPPGKTSTLSQG
ncbi:hypothetical protein V6N13_078120 [Hibiscus sabdariffa]